MKILTQLKTYLQDHISNLLNSINSIELDSLSASFSDFYDNLKLSSLIQTIEALDLIFRNSRERKREFKIKETRTRTLITEHGVITFRYTYYKRKNQSPTLKKYYAYILEALGIESYSRMTYGAVKLLLDENIKTNSILAAEKLGVSKMTVSNKMRKFNMIYKEPEKVKATPETLYIEADEKWIKKQHGKKINGHTPAAMAKLVLIHEGVDNSKSTSKRKILKNKHYIGSTELNPSDFWHLIYEYLDKKYDLNKVKNLFVSSDGGTWIKAHTEVFANAITVLDRFHFNKALNYIFKDKDLLKMAKNYLIHHKITDFNILVDIAIEDNPERKKYIKDKARYLTTHIEQIINQNHKEYKTACSMEGHISHVLARRLASRPKAFCDDTVEGYVQACIAQANSLNITPKKIKENIHFNPKNIIEELKKQYYSAISKIRSKCLDPKILYLANVYLLPVINQVGNTSKLIRKIIYK